MRLSAAAAYSAFVMIGISAGVGGVLLPAQMSDYGVDRSKIGLTFFAFSAGFMLAGSSTGALAHRYGSRSTLAAGTGVFAVCAFYLATRPAFAGFVAVQALLGYGIGVLESLLNAYLAALPHASRRVNRLHAFFGVGALLGPLLAAWMLRSWSWTSVFLVIGGLDLPLLAVFLAVFPRKRRDPGPELPELSAAPHPASVSDVPDMADVPDVSAAPGPQPERRGLLSATVREPAVLLGALFLAVYVGLEIGLGNWGFSFLVDGRHQSQLLAGYAISGYWLGLTAGRFVISPTASRLGLTDTAMTFSCLAGIIAAGGLIWLVSAPIADGAGVAVLGFFLGPLFPTTMAITPRLTAQRQVPTAIGVMNGVSVIGGSALPWLAGTIGQSAGISTLLPFSLVLAGLLLLIWWRLARHIPELVPQDAPDEPAGEMTSYV